MKISAQKKVKKAHHRRVKSFNSNEKLSHEEKAILEDESRGESELR